MIRQSIDLRLRLFVLDQRMFSLSSLCGILFIIAHPDTLASWNAKNLGCPLCGREGLVNNISLNKLILVLALTNGGFSFWFDRRLNAVNAAIVDLFALQFVQLAELGDAHLVEGRFGPGIAAQLALLGRLFYHQFGDVGQVDGGGLGFRRALRLLAGSVGR